MRMIQILFEIVEIVQTILLEEFMVYGEEEEDRNHLTKA